MSWADRHHEPARLALPVRVLERPKRVPRGFESRVRAAVREVLPDYTLSAVTRGRTPVVSFLAPVWSLAPRLRTTVCIEHPTDAPERIIARFESLFLGQGRGDRIVPYELDVSERASRIPIAAPNARASDLPRQLLAVHAELLRRHAILLASYARLDGLLAHLVEHYAQWQREVGWVFRPEDGRLPLRNQPVVPAFESFESSLVQRELAEPPELPFGPLRIDRVRVGLWRFWAHHRPTQAAEVRWLQGYDNGYLCGGCGRHRDRGMPVLRQDPHVGEYVELLCVRCTDARTFTT